MCKACEDRGKNWDGDDPRCAFNENGTFIIDEYGYGKNWNCATLNKLRDYMHKNRFISFTENQRIGYIRYDGMHLVLGWYKNRGRTEEFVVFSRIGGLSDLEICEEIIKEELDD